MNFQPSSAAMIALAIPRDEGSPERRMGDAARTAAIRRVIEQATEKEGKP